MSWRKLARLAVVLLAVFVAANIVTWWISGYFQRESSYRGEVAAVASHPDVHIVFAGDSHFAVPLNDLIDVDPHGPAYSIAFGGDSLRECFAKLRQVLNDSHTIDTIIVSADPHMFAKGRLESSNRSFVDWYFLRAGDRTGLKRGWASALLDQVPLLNNDFLQYLRKEAGTDLDRLRGRGRGGGDTEGEADGSSWDKLTEGQRRAAARSTGAEDHAGTGEYQLPFYWYERILALAHEHHVKVIGMRFPVHPDYAAQAPAAEVAAIDHFLLRNGVAQIIDLRGALSDPRDFQDEDHVNDAGVLPLLPIVEKRLGRPLMTHPPEQAAANTPAPH
ncbi:MAG TPA: hypothetical protein VGL55_08895 [Steroidobacteraceae bacterium]|jgi:hypothetical protein